MNLEVRHIDPAAVKAVATEILNELFQDPAAMRRYAVEQLRWLTMDDVMQITGFQEKKIRSLIRKNLIPMFRAPDSTEWRITREAWSRCEERLQKQGLLPTNRYPKPAPVRRSCSTAGAEEDA